MAKAIVIILTTFLIGLAFIAFLDWLERRKKMKAMQEETRRFVDAEWAKTKKSWEDLEREAEDALQRLELKKLRR